MDKYRSFRWYGRLTGFLGIVFFVSFMLSEGFETFKNAHNSFDALFVVTVFAFALSAYISGWFIEIIGGPLLILSGLSLGFYIGYSEVFSGFGNALFFSLPFLIPGIFYIISSYIKRRSPGKLNNNLS
ncbi:MAG: hypothetical protein B6D64_07765 [Bacteroidetes bacterium 4484_276]|nr:MAG: hypothetical protein B6D64_07765 [Bacteroidetes bacterium 4484_276]OYT14149.1 MAG: hypothetical protein B6I19_01460 [Bacteroidetes bacterium 4572_114]